MERMEKEIRVDDEHQQHKISVVIPAYNAAKTIKNALDSVRNQLLKELEIIVIDDGSEDDTKNTVLSYIDEHRDMDITCVYQENTGPGAARNRGIACAKGEYLAFLDADDVLPPGAYSALYYTGKKHRSDLVIGSYMRRVGDGEWYIPEFIKGFCVENEHKNCSGDFSVAICNPSLWNRLYRRQFLNESGITFLPEYHGEDVEFNVHVTDAAKRVHTVDAVVYYYTKANKGNTASTTWSYRNTSSRIRAIDRAARRLEGRQDDYALLLFWNQELSYFMDGFEQISDKSEQNALFKELKGVLARYRGDKKYEALLSFRLGVDLELVLQLGYEAYTLYREAFEQADRHHEKVRDRVWSYDDYRELVLKQFRDGDIGFRYIIKYAIAWSKFKLDRRWKKWRKGNL